MKPIPRRSFLALTATALAAGCTGPLASNRSAARSVSRIPVIYSTDLMHPHEDPDDHFDLACLYAMPEADLRAVILDNRASPIQLPGFRPVRQLNYLSGRHVPAAVGLSAKLKSPDDRALDQPAEFQNGVNLLLQTLQNSREKVAIIFVGSARDVMAAFNREPELFRAKVRSIHGFIGEASDPEFIEYNVGLDPQAFVGLMRSGLPFYWSPCFDGGLWQNRGHASFWKVRHRDVIVHAPEPLQRYFLYMLRKSDADPIAYLSHPTSAADRQWLMDGERNLWASALLGLAVNRPVCFEAKDVAGFSKIAVKVDERGGVRYGNGAGSQTVMRFEIHDQAHFAAASTAATAQLLTTFPLAVR